jgi:hypothetical protein
MRSLRVQASKRWLIAAFALRILVAAIVSSAMNMRSYDHVSLVYMSTDIVIADLSEDSKKQFTATVIETLYGSLYPGDRLDKLTPIIQRTDLLGCAFNDSGCHAQSAVLMALGRPDRAGSAVRARLRAWLSCRAERGRVRQLEWIRQSWLSLHSGSVASDPLPVYAHPRRNSAVPDRGIVSGARRCRLRNPAFAQRCRS